MMGSSASKSNPPAASPAAPPAPTPTLASKPLSRVIMTQKSTGSIPEPPEVATTTTTAIREDATQVTLGGNEPVVPSRDDSKNGDSITVESKPPLEETVIPTVTQDVDVLEETDPSTENTPILRTTASTISTATATHATRESSINLSKKINDSGISSKNLHKDDNGTDQKEDKISNNVAKDEDVKLSDISIKETTNEKPKKEKKETKEKKEAKEKKETKDKKEKKPKKEKKDKPEKKEKVEKNKESKQPKPAKRAPRDTEPATRVPPDDTTLGILAKKVVKHIKASPYGVVDFKELEILLKVPKQKISTITNVFEGVGLVKKRSKNVFEWTGPMEGDDENDDDDDDDFDETMSNRSLNSDDNEEDDHGRARRTLRKMALAREEAHTIYEEETLLDTWISRVRRVLHTQTNLSCEASDIVKAIFHPVTSSSSQHSNAARNNSKQPPASISKSTLIQPSNLLDETGKVQWSLFAVHAPHGSLVQVSSSRDPRSWNTGSDCQLFISTKTNERSETKLDDDYAGVGDDEATSKQGSASNPNDDSMQLEDIDTTAGNSPSTYGLSKIDSMEESTTSVLTNGETSPGKRYNHNQELLQACKRHRRDDDFSLDIYLLPTTFDKSSLTVKALAGVVKHIPDPLPPVYASAVAATNPTAAVSNRRSANGSRITNPKVPAPEDLQSWNFVAQLTHREGISDFFADPSLS